MPGVPAGFDANLPANSDPLRRCKHCSRTGQCSRGFHPNLDASDQPDGWMAITFLFLSILGIDVSGVRRIFP
jgi:hypothetical protein